MIPVSYPRWRQSCSPSSRGPTPSEAAPDTASTSSSRENSPNVGSAKSRQVHCRIIAATNAQLESRVDAGTFRLDLLYRLKRLVIQVPPLRERPVDITYFADYFLNLNKDPSNNAKASQELEKAFLAYSWPGNVRELKNEMEKIRLLHSGKAFYTLEDAPFLKEKSKTNIAAGESFQPQKPKKLKKEMIVSNEEILQNSNSYFRRIEIIKKLFQQYKNLSRKEICQITGVPDLTIGRDLKNLRDENYILKVEPTKSPRTHYFTLQAKD
jgi:transcriptional regulator with PAS, ATPase and Fis domain